MIKLNNITNIGKIKYINQISIILESFINGNLPLGLTSNDTISVYIDDVYVNPPYGFIIYDFSLSQPTKIEIRDNIESITVLSLDNLALNSNVLEQLKYMPSLENIYLGNNGITGTITNQFENLNNLIELSLSFNNLTGTLPNINNPVLSSLILNNNSFFGPFPTLLAPVVTLLANNNNFTEVSSTSFSITTDPTFDGNDCSINFSNNNLDVVSVDNIIQICLNSEPHTKFTKTLQLDGGTNAAPSPAGLANIALLAGYGWSVITN